MPGIPERTIEHIEYDIEYESNRIIYFTGMRNEAASIEFKNWCQDIIDEATIIKQSFEKEKREYYEKNPSLKN